MKQIIPLTQTDALLLSYAQFYKMGLCTKKEYHRALRQIRKDKFTRFLNEQRDVRWTL